MAQITQQHVPILTSGFVGLLVLAIIGLGVMNYVANKG